MLELFAATETAKTTTVATRVPSPRVGQRMRETGRAHHQHGDTRATM